MLFLWLTVIFNQTQFFLQLPILYIFFHVQLLQSDNFFLKSSYFDVSPLQQLIVLISFEFRGSFHLFQRHSSGKLCIFNLFPQGSVFTNCPMNLFEKFIIRQQIFYKFISFFLHLGWFYVLALVFHFGTAGFVE